MEKNKDERGWKEISVLQEQIYLNIPQEFQKPSATIFEKKFPYDMKPQECWMDLENNRIITFNLLEKQLQGNQVYAAIGEIVRVINHAYPESIQEPMRSIKTEIGIIGWFSFLTGGLDDDCYHEMFCFSFYDKMMFGSYHFPASKTELEQKNFLRILKSIRLNQILEE